VLRYYMSLSVERCFRVSKDFLSLRPLFHWSEVPVRGHVARRVLAATIEAVMAPELVKAKLFDPDLPLQLMTPRWALSVLKEVRVRYISGRDKQIKLANRCSALQAKVLETPTWSKVEIA
jgi:hypothetical protein